jgi:hypothetical protein
MADTPGARVVVIAVAIKVAFAEQQIAPWHEGEQNYNDQQGPLAHDNLLARS